MNINNFLIVFIILFIITILYLVINYTNIKIETFVEEKISGVPVPNITNDINLTITKYDISNNSNSNITLNTKEGIEYSDSKTDISGYISSSYIVDNSTDRISSLLKLNPPSNGVQLSSVPLYNNRGDKNINSGFSGSANFYNYIQIFFPITDIKIYTIEINYSSFEKRNNSEFLNNDIPQSNIMLYTSEGSELNHLKTLSLSSNGSTSENLIFEIDDNKLLKSYLFIFISPIIKKITLTKIRINAEKKEYTQSNLYQNDVIKFSSDIPSEQITVPSTYVATEIPEDEISTGTSISNKKKLNILFQNFVPWAIYNGKDYDPLLKIIPELLGRNCKSAIVSGKVPEIKQDGAIKFLSGTTSTRVIFPDFSLPEFYTICVISKYTSQDQNDISKRGRILTSVGGSTNWLLGHHWGVTGVMHNYYWVTNANQSLSNDKNEWIVSCVKSSSNKDKSLLINGISRATTSPPKMNDKNQNNKLTINVNNYGQNSDFGLSYVIIWDIVLTDNQLKLVSDSLQEYLQTGTELDLSNITITLNDGTVRERAAKSAMDIKKITCTNTNGLYWILPKNGNNANAKQIYCIMDSTVFGGGWMLALKGARDKNTFTYGSSYWTTDNTLNEEDLNQEDFTDAKYDIYNYYEASDCLAIFDGNDTNGELTFVNNFEYGWIWTMPSFYNNGGKISLLNYFKSGFSTFFYTTTNTGRLDYVRSYLKNKGWYLSPSYFDQYLVDVTCKKRNPLNRKIFSHQEQFKAWGLNFVPGGWNHAVRWGGSFNENWGWWDGIPNTNDVSCGIGIQAKNYSAGDAIICCQSSAGTNRSMGFKWFIR